LATPWGNTSAVIKTKEKNTEQATARSEEETVKGEEKIGLARPERKGED